MSESLGCPILCLLGFEIIRTFFMKKKYNNAEMIGIKSLWCKAWQTIVSHRQIVKCPWVLTRSSVYWRINFIASWAHGTNMYSSFCILDTGGFFMDHTVEMYVNLLFTKSLNGEIKVLLCHFSYLLLMFTVLKISLSPRTPYWSWMIHQNFKFYFVYYI